MRLTICEEARDLPSRKAIGRLDKAMFGKSNVPNHWIAKITAFDRTFGFKREFVRKVVDYSQANSKATRRVYQYWHLVDGYYEAVLGRNYERCFFRVLNGQRIDCEKGDVEEWLNSISE